MGELCVEPSHWASARGLAQWLEQEVIISTIIFITFVIISITFVFIPSIIFMIIVILDQFILILYHHHGRVMGKSKSKWLTPVEPVKRLISKSISLQIQC